MRTLISSFAAISLLIATLALAQSTTIVGTCDQYQSGVGGDFCGNTGAATGFFPFSGDVTNQRGGPFCQPSNTSQCGVLTVNGLLGIPICGTPNDGQTLCYQATCVACAVASCWVPCAP